MPNVNLKSDHARATGSLFGTEGGRFVDARAGFGMWREGAGRRSAKAKGRMAEVDRFRARLNMGGEFIFHRFHSLPRQTPTTTPSTTTITMATTIASFLAPESKHDLGMWVIRQNSFRSGPGTHVGDGSISRREVFVLLYNSSAGG